MLNYQGARNLLTGVDFDDKQEEIFFPLNDEKSAFFVCDFDKDGIDFKMVITPQANNIAYDMGVKKGKGGDSKKKSRVYNPPKVESSPISRIFWVIIIAFDCQVVF